MLLKRGRNVKRYVAAFLVIAMIVPLVSDLGAIKKASANETEGYQNWTYSTVGLTESDMVAAPTEEKFAGADFALDGSRFSGYVTFSQSGMVSLPLTQGGYEAPFISLGSVEGDHFWNCNDRLIKFGLRTYEDDKHYLSCGVGIGEHNWWFMDDDFELDEEIFLQVTFDYVAKDEDGLENDLNLTVQVNGVVFQNLIVQHNDWADGTAADLYVTDYVDVDVPMRAYATLSGNSGTVTARSVHELILSGIENNKTYCDEVELSIATGATDGLYEKDLDNVTIGGKEVNFLKGKYTIPAGVGATTVVVTDKMSNVQVYNIAVNAEHSYGKNGLCIQCGEKNTKEYKTWTFATAGIEDNDCLANGANGKQSYATIEGKQFPIDKTTFRGYVIFGGAAAEHKIIRNFEGPLLGFGAPVGGVYNNSLIRIGLTYYEEQTYLTCGLTDANAAQSINEIFTELPVAIGEEILLELFFSCIDHDGDGIKDDLKLGVWVNEAPITDTYLYFDNYTVNEKNEKAFILRTLGDDVTDDTYLKVRSAEVEVKKDESTYDLADSYGSQKMDLNQSKFSGYVTFGGAAPENTLIRDFSGPLVGFGTSEEWTYGHNLIKFGLTYSEGQTYLSCGVTNAEINDSIDMIFYEMPVAIGEEILLQCTFDCIDNDTDGTNDDLKLGVWVNGTAITDTYLYLNNYTIDENAQKAYVARVLNASETEQYITVRSASSEAEMDYFGWSFATADVQDGTIRSVATLETDDFATVGGYVVMGKGIIEVNGREVFPGYVLQSTGDYVIKRLYNGVTYENTIHLTDSRSHPVQIPALTHDELGGEEVMPIYGHYLPWWKSYKNEDGTETPICFTTDEYYELVREAGINTILWTEMNAADSQEAVLEQLRLAEKYHMGMYVWDTVFESLGVDEYWERLSTYSQYKSFLGINSIDEPSTDSYGIANIENKDSYKGPASIFNQYANLIGYVNAFPMLSKLQLAEGDLATIYKEHLKEAIMDVGGKILSYDRYPVEYDWTKESYLFGDEKFVMVNSPEFYKNLSVVRNLAAENNLPFKVAISTGDYCNAEDTYRQMTREDLLWSITASLAYGAKGISYYTMVEVDTSTDVGKDGAAEHGLIDCRGNKTKWYGYVQEANEHIAAIDHVLMKSLHQGVIPVDGTSFFDRYMDNYVENCVSDLEECIPSEEYGNYNLTSVSTTGSEYGALMGVFKYYPNVDSDDAYDAYYIVNADTSTKQTITIEFSEASTYSIIQGTKASYMETASTKCSITIPAGEGVLLVCEKDLTEAAKEPHVVWYEDIRPYRVDEATESVHHRAPEMNTETPQEYVFAGWFTDEACKIPLAKEVTTGGAYARFVDADVLAVKAQLNTEKTALRFVSTVDRLDYQYVGFDIRFGRAGITTESKNVYRRLYYMGNTDVMEYEPSVFSEFSNYFFAYNIYNIPEELQKSPFIVNSYWMTRDGTKVYGDSVSYSVEKTLNLWNEDTRGGTS